MMADVIVVFAPYLLGTLTFFFVIGAFLVAVFDPHPSWEIITRYERERAERIQQRLFIALMCAAVICLMALLGCFMIWWESY